MVNQVSIPLNVLADRLFSQSSTSHAILRVDFLDALIQSVMDDQVKEVVYYQHYLRQSCQLEVATKVVTKKGKHIDLTIYFKERDQYNQQSSCSYSSAFFNHVVQETSPFIEKETLIFNLLNFNIIQESDHFHNVYQLEPKVSPYRSTESLDLHYIELLKLPTCSLNSSLKKWLYFFRSICRLEQSQRFTEWLNHESYFKQAYALIEQDCHNLRKNTSMLVTTHHNKDHLLLKQGKVYGEQVERERIALNMIKSSTPYEDVMTYTNLTEAQIDKIALNYYGTNK